MKRHRGFSLVELTLVLVTIAILAGIALPRYGRAAARYRVEAAARRLRADLQYARTWARCNSTSVTITFRSTSPQYQTTIPDPQSPSQTYRVDLTRDPYSIQSLTASFTSGSTLTYNGYGLPSSAGTVVLQTGSASATVAIDSDTGIATYTLQ